MTLHLQITWTRLILQAQAQGQWRKAQLLALALNHVRYPPCLS